MEPSRGEHPSTQVAVTAASSATPHDEIERSELVPAINVLTYARRQRPRLLQSDVRNVLNSGHDAEQMTNLQL